MNSPFWGKRNVIKGKNGDNYLAMNIVNFEIDFHVEDDGNRSTPTLYFERSTQNPNKSVIYGGRSATVGPQAKLEHYQRALAYADIKLAVLSLTGRIRSAILILKDVIIKNKNTAKEKYLNIFFF